MSHAFTFAKEFRPKLMLHSDEGLLYAHATAESFSEDMLSMFRVGAVTKHGELDHLNNIMVRYRSPTLHKQCTQGTELSQNGLGVNVQHEMNAFRACFEFLSNRLSSYDSEEQLETNVREGETIAERMSARLLLEERRVLDQQISGLVRLWDEIFFTGELPKLSTLQ